MIVDPTLDRCFAPLIGKPCWHAKRGYGSFITFEFGEPSLEVREPVEPRPGSSADIRKSLARRLVTVRGEWHLWIYCCSWSIFDGNDLLGTSEDIEKTTASAIDFLDGQAFTGVSVTSSGASQFTFDLGGVLSTSPFDSDSEQWLLYQPDGFVFSVRAEGTYSHSPSNTPADTWLPLWKEQRKP